MDVLVSARYTDTTSQYGGSISRLVLCTVLASAGSLLPLYMSYQSS